MSDSLSDRIRAANQESRRQYDERLEQADYIIDMRAVCARRAQRRAALSYLKFTAAVFLGIAIVMSIFLLQYTLEGGFLR